MLDEDRCPPNQRFLMLIGRYSPGNLPKAIAGVRDHYNRERHLFDDAMAAVTEEFLTCAASLNSVVLQTCYCHADVVKGRVYDLVFDMDQPERFEFTRAVVQYNVIWGKVVSAGLVDGWHQAAFFDFPDGTPSLIESLPVDDFEAHPLVGVCDSVNWPDIALELERSRRAR